MGTLKERLMQVINKLGITKAQFEKNVGLSNGFVDKSGDNTRKSSLEKISNTYPEININWLMTGEGEMLKSAPAETPSQPRKKIPVYDARTIGGHNDTVANPEDNTQVTEEIDAGDWFPEATAAIHHYGDSMVEYPSGSILALKRVHDRRLIINGRNYVIETTEYRITKQLQYNGGDFIMAYSTNTETYPDGNLIHSPIKIPVETIRHIDLVLGCVTKEYSNGAVIIRKK